MDEKGVFMNINDVISEKPKFFIKSSGESVSYQASNEVLYFIEDHVNEKTHSLETGAGLSTITFALKNAAHTCIAPQEAQFENIKKYCESRNISTDKINFILKTSEAVLPGLDINELDFAFIDGCHGFPIPFIDWYYISLKLKVGGILIIDDTQIWTGQVLKEYLDSDPDWEAVETFRYAAVFKKKNRFHTKEWCDQLYVVKNSPSVSDEILKQHGLPLNGFMKRLSGYKNELVRLMQKTGLVR
jgi:predicted O-methyltransferase YrrM